MKAITLYQPWATCVAIGAKRIETRSWSTNYRGPLAIHAGKNDNFVNMRKKNYICGNSPFREVLSKAGMIWKCGPLPRGSIVAICELADVVKIGAKNRVHFNDSEYSFSWIIPLEGNEYYFGDYTPGRYAWLLTHVRILSNPIEINGAMSLWDWEPSNNVVFSGRAGV